MLERSNKSVTVLLRGGLGNQMFQYAAGLAVTRKNNAELFLDTTFLNDRFPRPQFTYRTYDLDVFNVDPGFTMLSRASTMIPIPGIWLGLDLAGIVVGDMLGLRKRAKEQTEYEYHPEVFPQGGNLYLWGFWHSEKYFENITSELKKNFTLKQPLAGEAKEIGDTIRSVNAVSLHVRRADYLLPKYQSTYGKTDLSFYSRAAEYIKERVKDPKFFVFSDDIAWCRENIKLDAPTTFVERASEGPKSSYHLELMSLCKHNIITNSTFSWWGAWRNENPAKIVIAPAKWYPGSKKAVDILPDRWLKM